MEPYNRVTGQDLFNSVAQGYNSNSTMQYVLRMNGKIDFKLLKRAVEISMIQEPVLGCRLKNISGQLSWEPVSHKDACCRQVNADNPGDTIHEFLGKELNPRENAQISVCLICGTSTDTICVKISHAACDGCGSKYYLKRLSELYTGLSSDPDFQPVISPQRRSTDLLYSAFGIKNKQEFFQPAFAKLESTWGMPADSAGRSQFRYELKSFTKEEFDSLHRYARQHHATINSVVLAAYYSSLLESVKPLEEEAEKEIQVMIDLRKYLPLGARQDICNLSSAVNLNLPVRYRDDMNHLVPIITDQMEEAKTKKAFLHGAVGVDLAAESGYTAIKNAYVAEWGQSKATGNCTPMLSNLGVLSANPIFFADVRVNQADYVSPAFYAPAVMLGMSTYCSRLTLCISYYTPEFSVHRIKKLLENTYENLCTLTNKAK